MPVSGNEAHIAFAKRILAEERGDREAADRWLKIALSKDPDALPLVEDESARLMRNGDVAEARRLFRKLSVRRKNDATVRLAFANFLASDAHRDGDARAEAIREYRDCLEMMPGNPQMIGALFEVLPSPSPERAELLELLVGDDAATALAFASMAGRLAAADETWNQRIAKKFSVAVAKEPADPLLARTASDFFRRIKKPAEAIGVLEKHVAAAPWSLDLRTRLGILYFAGGQDAQGLDALGEVVAIDPSRPLAHQALAKYFRRRGETFEAVTHESERIKLAGGSPDEFLRLADEWLAADRPADARLLLEKAVLDHPENAKLRMKLAVATRRDPATRSRAAALFKEAELLAGPNGLTNPVDLIESAESSAAAGDAAAAEKKLREAIRKAGPDAEKQTATALRRLAELWEAQNRNREAAAALRKRADNLDPR